MFLKVPKIFEHIKNWAPGQLLEPACHTGVSPLIWSRFHLHKNVTKELGFPYQNLLQSTYKKVLRRTRAKHKSSDEKPVKTGKNRWKPAQAEASFEAPRCSKAQQLLRSSDPFEHVGRVGSPADETARKPVDDCSLLWDLAINILNGLWLEFVCKQHSCSLLKRHSPAFTFTHNSHTHGFTLIRKVLIVPLLCLFWLLYLRIQLYLAESAMQNK